MSIQEMRVLLRGASDTYTDEEIGLCMKLALAEVEAYCNRQIDFELESVAMRIAKIKLNTLNTEGLASQSHGGGSESYINGYPEDIKAVLNRKRKMKVL